MSRVIAQVNYNLAPFEPIDRAQKRATAREKAGHPGVLWKIWLHDQKTGKGGGIFLFEDRRTAEDWLTSRRDRVFPAGSDVTVTLLDVDEEISELTRAPLLLDRVREAANVG